MRTIKYIGVHCTATAPNVPVQNIKDYWKNKKGWKYPGYHYIIKANGQIIQLLDERKIANGVKGFNEESIHIGYIGGKDKNGASADTRTKAQEQALFDKLVELSEKHPKAKIQGHRDFDNPKKKTCPKFDVTEWLQNYVPDIEHLCQ